MISVPGGGHWGGGIVISARDLALMGLLVAQGGAWNGKQLLPKGWTDELVKPCPVAPFYGLMWWLNTDRRQFAAASERSYFAFGWGSHIVWIDPDNDLVTVLRWIERKQARWFRRPSSGCPQAMSLDYSAVPRMPDGRTALEIIEAVAATSRAVRCRWAQEAPEGMANDVARLGRRLRQADPAAVPRRLGLVDPLDPQRAAAVAAFHGLCRRHAGPGRQRSARRRARYLVGDALRRPRGEGAAAQGREVLPHRLLVRRHGVGPSRDADARAHQAHRVRRRRRAEGNAQADREAAQAAARRWRRRCWPTRRGAISSC